MKTTLSTIHPERREEVLAKLRMELAKMSGCVLPMGMGRCWNPIGSMLWMSECFSMRQQPHGR
ncbi:MAG: hypothetical protein NNA19_03910 [Nitrospira sp.]|nr:hypothetical protein [Nitrospira sp.]MCP9474377.1 hypothetical protein [Nitrospira sp.]